MFGKRKELAFLSALLFVGISTIFSGCSPKNTTEIAYAEKASSLLGTKGKGFGVEQRYLEAGYTFPGPTLPFGMVQFTTTFFDENKGYVVNQMSGAGCHNMGNLPMLPLPALPDSSPGDMMKINPEINIREAHAGYYSAELFNGIGLELTATTRTGMALINFAGTDSGTVIIGTGINSTTITEAEVKITGPAGFEGFADGGNFCGAPANYKIYFVGEFSVDALEYGTWKEDTLRKESNSEKGPDSGAWFTFNTKDSPELLYKIAISYVSVENARENLEAENANWDFNRVRRNAEAEWNKVLGKIELSGGTEDKQIQFYSHLYHSFINPSIFNDVNGEYIGSDLQVHHSDRDYYTAFSNWDTYRTQIQLLSMLFPTRSSDIVSSMIDFAQRSGGGWPRWVCANYETGIMQGDPTSVLVANAWAFGADQFDSGAALEIMRRGAEIPGTLSQKTETRQHLEEYLSKGYISDFMGASMLLEYTSADFAIGRFALDAFNDTALAEKYLNRSLNWRKIFNPETNWLQSRNADGSWKPLSEDWREASYKNYFWMVPYDIPVLVDTIGGMEVAEKRLDEFFEKLNANYYEEFFAAGNEPSFQSPWTYNFIGLPSKTQETVYRILNEQYSNRDCGLPGNDDMGAMAAWYVFASMGLYPMEPGVAGFSVNTPSFEKICIHIAGSGEPLLIKGGSVENKYITGLKVNGGDWSSTWIPYSKINKGGELEFQVSEVPGDWGSSGELPDFTKIKTDE